MLETLFINEPLLSSEKLLSTTIQGKLKIKMKVVISAK